MKKAIILGSLFFFALNLVGIQNANAQVNKQREQMLQAANDTSVTSDQIKLNTKAKKVQKGNAVNIQREQMLHSVNEAGELNKKDQPDLIIVSMEDIVKKLGVNQDSSYLNKMMTTEPGKTLKSKKILIKPEKRPKE